MADIRTPRRIEGWLLVGVVVAVLAWSGIAPHSLGTWALEVVWIVAGLPLVLSCWRRFPLTRLLCWLLAIHAVVLAYGGHYTYAETPLGDWARELLGTQRNNYDRLGHFLQGFVPAILFREWLVRLGSLRPGRLLWILVTACALAFSALFEILEGSVGMLLGSGAEDYLATQGDVWDTQWDMICALAGAVVAQVLLNRFHDRQLGLTAAPRRTPD